MLTKNERKLVPRSYEQVGDMIIFSDFPKTLKNKEKEIAKSFLKQNRHVKVVAKKTKKFSGKYRLPQLKILAGENRKETIHRENGIKIKINPETSYFSSKSGSERIRIAKLVKPNEKVLIMFSGVGPFGLTIAKYSKAKEVHGIEINPTAHRYAQENVLLNKAYNVIPHKGDVNKIIPTLNQKFDRIIMPAPKTSEKYLDLAITYCKRGGMIHFYTFENEENFDRLKKKFDKFKKVQLIKTGQTSPRVYRICLDLKT